MRPVINHTTLLTSLAFDHLAAHNAHKHIVFLHATYVAPDSNNLLQWNMKY